MKNKFSKEFKQTFDMLISEHVHNYFIEKIPFILYIVNNDNWDYPLPDSIKHKEILKINFIDEVFTYCNYNNLLGNLELKLMFGDKLYTKILKPKEIVAVFDIDMNPLVCKPYKEKKDIDKAPTTIVSYNRDIGIVQSLMQNKVVVISTSN